jgi:hypothetical protein
MGGACAAAILAGAAITLGLGGDWHTAMLAAAAIGVGAIATFLPVVFTGGGSGGAGNFGVHVLIASMVRALLILSIAVYFTQTRDLPKRPFWVGAATGAGFILIVESTLAISILSRIERARLAARSTQTSTNR